ncbi:hypothetical protein SAMN02910456_01923 [Ruminococcaceae bacterium YRB3002]|nr:hypothetical protein SAMN02910456_01923 [Ruminococcaceae bacterium YRB3002]
MYLLCYGRSDSAVKTGNDLIDRLGGRWIENADFFASRLPLTAGERDAVIVMLLPLEASVEILSGNYSPTLSGLPVICVSPDGLFAAVVRRGDESTLADCGETYAAICDVLGPKCFKSFGSNADIAPDLTTAIKSYGMTPNDPDKLKSYLAMIRSGEKMSIYTDLPVVFAEPSIDSMIFNVNRYSRETKESFVQSYISLTGSSSPAVFITCAKLPECNGNPPLVLTPKLVSVGLELTGRCDPEYAAVLVLATLENHGIDARSVSTVAVSQSARESEAVHKVAEMLGASVTAFSTKMLKEIKLPLKMTFAPVREDVDIATAACYQTSESGRILIRRAAEKSGIAISACLKRGNILLTE